MRTKEIIEKELDDLIKEQNTRWYALLKKCPGFCDFSDEDFDSNEGLENIKKRRLGDNYKEYLEIMNYNNLFSPLYQELDALNFEKAKEISPTVLDKSVALEVHSILLEQDFYNKHISKDEDFNYAKILYSCCYNDNWNDLIVKEIHLLKDLGKDTIPLKIIEIYKEENLPNDEYESQYKDHSSIEIEMYHCSIYSFNDNWQSLIITKERMFNLKKI
jgi:hypothetical protein